MRRLEQLLPDLGSAKGALVLFFLSGALLGPLSVALPHPRATNAAAILALSGGSLLAAVVIAARPAPSEPVLAALIVLGIALVSVGVATGGSHPGIAASLYVWPGLVAVAYLPRRLSWPLLGLVAAGLAAGLAGQPIDQAADTWVLAVATALGAATVVGGLLRRAERDERLRTVEHRLARRLASARSSQPIVGELLELLGTGLGFDHAELWLADAAGTTLRLDAEWRRDDPGAFGAAGRRLLLSPGEGLAGLAWQSGEPIFDDDPGDLDIPRAGAIRHDGIGSCVALPVTSGGRVVAVGVLARLDPRPLEPGLRQTLRSVGVQLGHFVERRQAEHRLAEETMALAAVARATGRLTDALRPADVLDAICDAGIEVSSATHAFLAVPQEAGEGLAVGATAPRAAGEPVFGASGPSAALRAFRSGRAVLLPDVAADPGANRERVAELGIESALLQPILRDGEPVAVLGLAWRDRHGLLDPSVRRHVRLLADQAAMALARAGTVDRLEAAARTDPLTGLTNRRGWDEHLERELAGARRDGRPVSVALVDLDGLKRVNDESGHAAGDLVLREVSDAWVGQLRTADLLARVGGDEFAVLLPGCRLGDGTASAERLRSATPGATACFGVATWDGDESAASLMERADTALYAAKAGGRDRVSAVGPRLGS